MIQLRRTSYPCSCRRSFPHSVPHGVGRRILSGTRALPWLRESVLPIRSIDPPDENFSDHSPTPPIASGNSLFSERVESGHVRTPR